MELIIFEYFWKLELWDFELEKDWEGIGGV